MAIARAYVKGNIALVLDEPSSNLDSLAENRLIHMINRLAKDKAVILATHNLRYTKNVDRVLFMKEGEVVEDGCPGELMRVNGNYAMMRKEQEGCADAKN